jgi:hypothetical protein
MKTVSDSDGHGFVIETKMTTLPFCRVKPRPKLEQPEIEQVLLTTIRESITQGFRVWMARNACRAVGVHVGDTG